MSVWIGRESYTDEAKEWLDVEGKHYLQNAPPGCLFALAVRQAAEGLCGVEIGVGPRLGLLPGLPYGTASTVLRAAIAHARRKRIRSLIAYHDRTRHTGGIYRKAGFRRDGGTPAKAGGWGSRSKRKSADYDATAKRRWRIDLTEAA